MKRYVIIVACVLAVVAAVALTEVDRARQAAPLSARAVSEEPAPPAAPAAEVTMPEAKPVYDYRSLIMGNISVPVAPPTGQDKKTSGSSSAGDPLSGWSMGSDTLKSWSDVSESSMPIVGADMLASGGLGLDSAAMSGAPVPEPNSLAVLTFGIVATLLRRKRR